MIYSYYHNNLVTERSQQFRTTKMAKPNSLFTNNAFELLGGQELGIKDRSSPCPAELDSNCRSAGNCSAHLASLSLYATTFPFEANNHLLSELQLNIF